MISKKLVFILFIVLAAFVCYMPSSIAEAQEQNIFTSPTLGAKFVLIPSGTFKMGSPANEVGRINIKSVDIEALHEVTISKPFFMQTTEVTQGQWRRVMGDNPSSFGSCGDDCPVEKVSWEDVQKFIKKLNSMEGTDKYRLPTEAQWEYAARAGSATRFYTGDSEEDLSRAGWYGSFDGSGNSGGKTHPVGQKIPNAWGLYDMHGNVWEWVTDWMGAYPSGSVIDPVGPSTGSPRVARGGSYISYAKHCRSANRLLCVPGLSIYDLGFRLIRIR